MSGSAYGNTGAHQGIFSDAEMFCIKCDNRWGVLKQITAVISDTHTNIRNMESRSQNGQACVDVVLEIADLKHLQKIMDGVRQIPGVHDLQRLQRI